MNGLLVKLHSTKWQNYHMASAQARKRNKNLRVKLASLPSRGQSGHDTTIVYPGINM